MATSKVGTLVVEAQIDGQRLDTFNAETILLRYRDTLYGPAIYRLQVRSGQWDVWDRLVTRGTDLDFRLRWTIRGEGGATSGPWKHVRVGRVRYRYIATSVDVLIDGTCLGGLLGERCHANAFVDQSVSQMVQRIAAQNGFRSQVAGTRGKFTEYQCDMPDGQFIRNRLLPLAVDKGGVGGFCFWVADGRTLVFEPLRDVPIDLGPFSFFPPPGQPAKNLMHGLSVRYDPILDPHRQVGALEVWGMDPWRAQEIHWTANDKTVRYPKLAPQSPKPPGGPTRIAALTRPEPGETGFETLRTEASGRWSERHRSMFRTCLQLPAQLTPLPGRTVCLNVFDPGGKKHFSSGLWLVYATEVYTAVKKRVDEGRESEVRLYLERRNFS